MAKRKFSAEIVIEPCKRPVGSALRIYDGDTLLASLHIPKGELTGKQMCLIAYTDIGDALRAVLPKEKVKKKVKKEVAKKKKKVVKRKLIRRKQK